MVKKFSAVALAGLLALPAVALAQPALEQRIDALTRELNELRAQMEDMQDENEEIVEEIEEKAERWDLASRIQISGDIRNRLDMHWAETVEHWAATDVAQGIVRFQSLSGTDGFLNPTVGGFGTPLANFGLSTTSLIGDATTPGTLLGNLSPALAGGEAAFVTAATGAGLAPQQAEDTFALFSDPTAGALVAQFGSAGLTVGDLLGALSTPENIANTMRQLTPASRASIFRNMGFNTVPATDYEEDNGLWSTRLRLNLRAKATEDIEFKGRLVAYKAWGIQHNPMPESTVAGTFEGEGVDSPYFLNSRTFDGTVGRKPEDSDLIVDRAFMNWNNIAGLPVWFSIGRRPTTDGPPAHLRMGLDQRMATPVAFMDYPFDGISLGYAYRDLFGLTGAPGRIRFCYGRGFEAGPDVEDSTLNDVDFMGISWDIYKKGNRFVNVQSFAATNLFNVPGDTFFPDPIEQAQIAAGATDVDGFLDRTNIGNVYHTSGVYMDKVQDLNYFLALGWSHTDPSGIDSLGNSILSDFWEEPEKKDGYAAYVGVRYDLDNYGLKFGAEYNYGSKNWLGFTPGHDDMYNAKLWTRGSVYEVYTIWDIPGGEAISKFGDAFIRLGYQHYDVEYTYSGMWLGTPQDLDEIKNDPLEAQFYPHFDTIDQIYLTFEAWF